MREYQFSHEDKTMARKMKLVKLPESCIFVRLMKMALKQRSISITSSDSRPDDEFDDIPDLVEGPAIAPAAGAAVPKVAKKVEQKEDALDGV